MRQSPIAIAKREILILETVLENPGITIENLARKTGFRNSGVRETVYLLINDGIIKTQTTKVKGRDVLALFLSQ